MSRSAIERTRFAVSAPHASAYAKAYTRISPLRNGFSLVQIKNRRPQLPLISSCRSPSSNAYSSLSNSLQNSPSPPSETPAEKVARLRAARFKARMAQIPLWDRVVVEGRRWADRMHRITVYFFLLASILSVLVFVVTLADMIIWNRRKRRQWVKDQAVLYQEGVTKAIEAESSGKVLSEEQRLILGRERVRFDEQEAAERRKKERWWITKWLFSGLKMGDEDGEEDAPRPASRSGDESESPDENEDQTSSIRITEPEATIAQSSIMQDFQEQNPQILSQTLSEPAPLADESKTSLTQDSGNSNSTNSISATEQTQPKRSWWGGN